MQSPAASRWHQLLQKVRQRLPPSGEPTSASATKRLNAGFLFSGQAQEIIPRNLLLDTRLTPLERNAWQVLRMLTAQGLSTPSYEDLQPFLGTIPCGGQASRESIARVLTMLRLTRWLTLLTRPRNQVDGRFNGSLYVLHDEPLTHRESIELDAEYLELLGNSLSHPIKAVRVVAEHMVAELFSEDGLELPALPGRLEMWAERIIHSEAIRNSERGEIARVRNFSARSSESELGLKAPPHHAVRNPNPDSTVLGIKESTVLRAHAREGPLQWPPSLQLSPAEQHACRQALDRLPVELRQPVLDEANARCANGVVRKPAAYLLGLIQKALTGDFKLWAASRPGRTSLAVQASQSESPAPRRNSSGGAKQASPLAKSYLEELRALARPSSQPDSDQPSKKS